MDEKTSRIMKELEFGYDQMAQKFSQTRKFFWRDLEFIANYIKNDDKILDYGCGNGRLLEILKDKKVEYVGMDISGKLIKLATEKYGNKNTKFIKINSSQSLAFPDDYFNAVVSIAVFHHFPQEYARKTAKELFRIVKPGGKIIVTVWNLSQERFMKFGKREEKDLLIPFRNNEQKKYFDRYHRLYTKEEIGKIFSEVGFKIGRQEVINKKNIIIVGKKAG